MKIRAKGRIIDALAIRQDVALIQGEERPTLAIAVPGAITSDDVEALSSGVIDVDDGYKTYKGFTGLIDVEVLLYKPTEIDMVFDRTAELEQRMFDLEKEVTEANRQRDEALAQAEAANQQLERQRIALAIERDVKP